MLVEVASLVGILLFVVVFEDLFGFVESTAALDIRFLDLDLLLGCFLSFSFTFYKIAGVLILVGQIEKGVATTCEALVVARSRSLQLESRQHRSRIVVHRRRGLIVGRATALLGFFLAVADKRYGVFKPVSQRLRALGQICSVAEASGCAMSPLDRTGRLILPQHSLRLHLERLHRFVLLSDLEHGAKCRLRSCIKNGVAVNSRRQRAALSI